MPGSVVHAGDAMISKTFPALIVKWRKLYVWIISMPDRRSRSTSEIMSETCIGCSISIPDQGV